MSETPSEPAGEPSLDDLLAAAGRPKVEPHGDFREWAANLRQMYVALVEAGFSEGPTGEALSLLGHLWRFHPGA